MGPFMVEIVFCRVTRRGRKKKSGMNKLARENMRNDGPMQSFIPKDDMLRVTLDLSDNGPVFSALDDMMLRLSMEGAEREKSKGSGDAKKALKNLLRSGIPGIEGMFGGQDAQPRGFGKKAGKKGFHTMNEGSKKKFMTAIFGEDGTQIDSATAAALLAATCSGGNPEIGNKLAELLVPNMGQTVDPAMMGALMSACSLINAGAGTEAVMKAMMEELAASGLSEEEILIKTQLLMKAFGKEETGSTAEYKLLSKQKNKALVKAEIAPKDFTAIMLAHKVIAACGTSPENVAKLLIIKSTLGKKGGNPLHVATAMKNLGAISEETKAEIKESILKAWAEPGKLTKADVAMPVRMHLALDNENEPAWVEVKNLKDIVGGVSPTSQEAIELNLARAVKSGGLRKDDIGRGNMALHAISLLGVDPVQLAKVMFMEKTICDNGVPAIEVGRVISDGLMPPEATQGLIDEVKDKLTEDLKPADVEMAVKIYNNLKFKSNIPTEVIEYVDKTLIQVRCSLEDVADNMFSTMRARGEKEMKIVRDVTETLKKTGATASVVGATIMPPLKELTGKREVELTRVIGRNLKDVDYSSEDVKGAVTDMIVKIMEEDPTEHAEAVAALESVFKDLGESPFAIKDFVAANLPPPPTPPEEIERRRQIAEELERLEREEQERARLKALRESMPAEDDFDADERKPGNKKLDALRAEGGDSRRGSLIPPPRSRQGSIVLGGTERRGSYYDQSVTARASVAVITDDPEHKSKLKESLSGVFNEEEAADLEPQSSVIINQPGGDVEGDAAAAARLNGHAGLTNGFDSLLNGLPADADEGTIRAALTAAGMDPAERDALLGAYTSTGYLHTVGGVTKFRRPEDMRETAQEGLEAFDAAILAHRQKAPVEIAQLSAESRELMQKILSSNSSQDEISSRVAALLAGTALSTSRGELSAKSYGEVPQIAYDVENENMSNARRRRDNFQMPDIPEMETLPGYQHGETGYAIPGVPMRERGEVKRASIKRQSDIMREARKSRQEEQEEERKRKQSYYRRVTGLRRAKVPLMVYSCGGFSRCFRVARFYDVEGPPVGIFYERPGDERKDLNPDL